MQQTQLCSLGSIVFSTYFGGTGADSGYAIAVDSYSNIYITGGSESVDLPVTGNAVQANNSGLGDAFILKLTSTCNSSSYYQILLQTEGPYRLDCILYLLWWK